MVIGQIPVFYPLNCSSVYPIVQTTLSSFNITPQLNTDDPSPKSEKIASAMNRRWSWLSCSSPRLYCRWRCWSGRSSLSTRRRGTWTTTTFSQQVPGFCVIYIYILSKYLFIYLSSIFGYFFVKYLIVYFVIYKYYLFKKPKFSRLIFSLSDVRVFI